MYQHLSIFCFYKNIRRNIFCGLNIFTEVVFASGLSIDAGISIWGIVWVTRKIAVSRKT
jgi:hypothetical protein